MKSCIICSDELEYEDVACLSCGHTFHFTCIDKWIKKKSDCPICRKRTRRSVIRKLFFSEEDQDEFVTAELDQEEDEEVEQEEELSQLKEQLQEKDVGIRRLECLRTIETKKRDRLAQALTLANEALISATEEKTKLLADITKLNNASQARELAILSETTATIDQLNKQVAGLSKANEQLRQHNEYSISSKRPKLQIRRLEGLLRIERSTRNRLHQELNSTNQKLVSALQDKIKLLADNAEVNYRKRQKNSPFHTYAETLTRGRAKKSATKRHRSAYNIFAAEVSPAQKWKGVENKNKYEEMAIKEKKQAESH
uniref:RING-type domain-containing protein n=1 Tax=Ditylenchus dipsaci TaxID=166011 RepID=A0A915EUV7_9BILA